MVGLDGAGKSSIMYSKFESSVVTVVPTIAFNVENILHLDTNLQIWDIGGQSRVRTLWPYYIDDQSALVFVIDSADRDRLPEAIDELISLLSIPNISGVPLIVLAHKQDVPSALTVLEIINALPE